MQIDLLGRNALITGGSKGLGLATALRFSESGANVAIVARGAGSLEEARKSIAERSPGRKVIAVVADVASPSQIEQAWRSARETLGPIDILVNNAGGHALGSFVEVTDAMWDHDLTQVDGHGAPDAIVLARDDRAPLGSCDQHAEHFVEGADRPVAASFWTRAI